MVTKSPFVIDFILAGAAVAAFWPILTPRSPTGLEARSLQSLLEKKNVSVFSLYLSLFPPSLSLLSHSLKVFFLGLLLWSSILWPVSGSLLNSDFHMSSTHVIGGNFRQCL